MTAAIGPRVGGAHVDVNMKFDDKSLAQVGRKIHSQLAEIGQRNGRIYREIGKDAVTAWRAALGSIVAAGPHIGSAISAVSGAATTLAGALYSVGQSAYALLPVATSLGIAGMTLAIGFEGFGDAINATDPKKLAAALERLTPNARSAALAMRELKLQIRKQVQTTMFQGLTSELEKLRSGFIPTVSKGFGEMAKSINGLIKSVLRYVNSAAGLKQINGLFKGSASIFKIMAKSVVPFLDGFLRLVNALTPAGERLAQKITNIALKFQTWTKAEGFGKRINDMMLRAEKTAGLLFKVFSNLGKALANVFNTTNPSTNTFLQMLVDVTGKFLKFTQSVDGQNSIAKWAADSVQVMGQFGKTIAAIFKVLEKLSDPRIIMSFLKTVENAFNILGALPLDQIVSMFATFAEILQPISGPMLAIVVAGASLNILFGNMIGQLGGVFAAFGGFKKILDGVKKGLGGIGTFFKSFGASTGKHAKDVGKFGTAFRELGGVLAKGLKFAGIAGLALTIVSVIAKSDELKKKVGEAFKAVGEVFSALFGAFKEVYTALQPVLKVLQPIFDLFEKLVGLAVGIFLDTVILAFKSLAKAIEGIGSIVAGFINILVGLFTLDFKKVGAGFKQMFGGIGKLLLGLLGLFVTFFAPARLAKFGLGFIKGLGGGIVRAFPKILSVVGKFLGFIFKGFVKLPGLLFRLGGQAIAGLGRALGAGASKAAGFAGGIVKAILSFFAQLPGRLLTFGQSAIHGLGSAISTGITWLGNIASKIVTGIVSFISQLPGRLFTLGQSAIRGLGSMFSTGITWLRNIAGQIVSGVVSFIGQLPGRLLAFGQQAVTRLASAVGVGIGWLRNIASQILSGIVSFISQLPGRLLSFGQAAIARLAGAVGAGIGRLRSIASQILSGIVSFISQLPGKLLSFGQQAINRLAGAVSAGIGRLRTIAGSIVKAIVDAVAGLPGQMLEIGKRIVGAIADGISWGIDKVKGAMSAVADIAGKFWPGSPVKEGPLKKWNRGADASGGGRNVIEALTAGLRDVSPIKRAMRDVADAVAGSAMSVGRPSVLAAGAGGASVSRSLSVVINNPRAETGSDSLTRTTRNLAYLGLT